MRRAVLSAVFLAATPSNLAYAEPPLGDGRRLGVLVLGLRRPSENEYEHEHEHESVPGSCSLILESAVLLDGADGWRLVRV
jgi:hypothetical protein